MITGMPSMYGGLSALMDEGGAELDRWIRSGEMRAEALEIMAAATGGGVK